MKTGGCLTRNRLDLQTLGSQPITPCPKISPNTALDRLYLYAQKLDLPRKCLGVTRGCHTTLEVGEWALGDEGRGKRGANRIDSSGERCDTPLCPSRRTCFTCRCSPMLPMRSSYAWRSLPEIKEINSR